MQRIGFTIIPICPRTGEIAGDIHSVHALDRTNWKMLYSIARHQRPSCGHDHQVKLIIQAELGDK